MLLKLFEISSTFSAGDLALGISMFQLGLAVGMWWQRKFFTNRSDADLGVRKL